MNTTARDALFATLRGVLGDGFGMEWEHDVSRLATHIHNKITVHHHWSVTDRFVSKTDLKEADLIVADIKHNLVRLLLAKAHPSPNPPNTPA